MPVKLSYYYEMGRKMHPVGAAPKVWNYLKFRALPREVKTSVRAYTPQIASVIITKRCNLACEYCSAANMMNARGPIWRESEATVEKIKRIFANPLFSNCLLVDLLGGEPLLVEELEAIVAYLARRGHMVNFATNGLLLAGRIDGLKRAGISRINVSLYDTNRAVLDRDLPGINRIFPVHASRVLLRSELESNQDDILARARAVHGAGCRSLRFYIYRPMGVAPNSEEIIAEDLPAYVEFRKRVEAALPGFCLWPATIRKGAVEKRCPQLWQRISCDVSGTMGICCGTDQMLKGPHGNLFDGSPDAVWNHPTLVRMREQLKERGSEPPDICKTCNLLGDPGW
jgi:Radical SAM superfamily/Iron-sulfur cluster-binding domain/4Fe-4S single cluster domain